MKLTFIRFGGKGEECCFNDTWSFDTRTEKWTELACLGSVPSPRHSHAACLIDDIMYVFGGETDDGHALDDLFAFKLRSAITIIDP